MEEQYTLEEWLGMMEEGKLSRLAAGVGLGAAAMMGGAKDVEAQAKSEPAPTTTTRSWTSTMGRNSDGAPTPPKDSTSTQTSRDMQMAVDKAAFDLKSRGIDPRTVAGFRRDIKQNPDGTWSVTMKPNTEKPQMEEDTPERPYARPNTAGSQGSTRDTEWNSYLSALPPNFNTDGTPKPSPRPSQPSESYTLEEWMGMMEEAGVNLNELSPETLASYRAKAVAQKSNIKDKYHGTTSPTTGQKYSRDMIGLPPEATAAGDQRKSQKRTAGIAQANKNLGQQAVKAAASGDNSVFSKIDYRDDELGAGAQWQIDRARKSALNQPTGQPKMAAESINENTVARLQSLAGIRPTE